MVGDNDGNSYLHQAQAAGTVCDRQGWTSRPTWAELAAGRRPPQPEPEEISLGEWQHGWQYHACNAIEHRAFQELLADLALPSRSRNAQATGKTRLHSCRGRFSTAWLTTCPTSPALSFDDVEVAALVRMRLGLAICLDGPDAHGYSRLADSTGGRTHARHSRAITAWRQVFVEAGGEIPDRNQERLLRNTHIPVPADSQLRMDLVVPGLNVASGLPLFCDVTVISPLSRTGLPRAGTSNAGGRLLARAQSSNDGTYDAVRQSGLGALYCLGFEVFGRWGAQCVDILPKLAVEKSRGMHPRLRRGTALAYQLRWAGLISIGVMKVVSAAALRDAGSDLASAPLEDAPGVADLLV